MRVGWSTSLIGRFTCRKEIRYPLHRRLGDWPGQVRKISPPPGFDHQTVQHVASRYTDYAISARSSSSSSSSSGCGGGGCCGSSIKSDYKKEDSVTFLVRK